MESAIVVTIGLLVLLGGTVALLAKQRILPWSLPALRTFGGGANGAERELDPKLPRNPESDEMVEPLPASPTAVVRPTIVEVSQKHPVEDRIEIPDPVRLDLVPGPAEALVARLDQIEERLDQIAQVVDRQSAELSQEFLRVRADLEHRTEVDDARQDALLERLRADVLVMVARTAAEGSSRPGVKRPEVSAELYARLARLEAALAAVTNPILLPGEQYIPPTEFLPEALVWENWNEVGERAFSLADAYSAQRLHLSQETRGEFDVFVTKLRMLLTRSIYPNLQLDSDAAQQGVLRSALEEIAFELPKLRDKLEWEHREGGSI